MKLSIALCTFNGERYLAEQLASILSQQRLPDEMVICDDASSDGSILISQQFAELSPFPVRLVVNPNNLGTTKNFDQAIGLCSGDAIVLADQDDVWLPHKLAALEAALCANPDAGFVFSDAEIVDEHLKSLGYSLWEAIDFGAEEQERFRNREAFVALLRRHRVTGATMAFRARYREIVQPIPAEWLHDAWIALIISSIAPCALISQPLIRYRQHSQQQLGGKKRGLYTQFLSARSRNHLTFETVAQGYMAAQERLKQIPRVRSEVLDLLAKKAAHCHRRMTMRNRGRWRVPLILRELWQGNYRRFSAGWKAIAQDLLLP
jgi:glycosyltransferase involved in cell wall biosynthesis